MILAGSGHRPNKLSGGYSPETFDLLVRVADKALADLKPIEVISGMALGWDQALARAALARGIPFTAAVPFKEQPDQWPYPSREDYYDLIGMADRIVYVSGPGYAAWKMQARNEWMCKNSDGLLVLWNGSSGGTASCIEYAKRIGKPIVRNVFDELVLNGR